MNRFLNRVEWLGNKLPHPFILFVYFAIAIIIISWIVSQFNVAVEHPTTSEVIEARSLFSGEGLLFMLESMITNFTASPRLGLILTMMLGIGLAQQVGLFDTFMKATIMRAPTALVTYAIIFAAVLGNIASDAAMIIIPPLAAMVFYSLGRHPIAGMCAGFAGVAAGFTANIIIAGTDALLAGITEEAAQSIIPEASVTPLDNWFFMSVSTFMVILVVGLVTTRIIEPRLGKFNDTYAEPAVLGETATIPSKQEIKGLIYAVIGTVIYLALIGIALLPENSVLRGEDGESPLLSNIVPIILVWFIIVSVAYGVTVGTIKKTADIPNHMTEAMKSMVPYIVLVFAIAQFIAYFNWTNLSTILAVNTSEFLEGIGFTGLGLMVAFILLAALLNQMITSGSAQWALMAPVFVPMLMLLGYDPAYAQLAYRIGDSASSVLTPLNPYLIMVLGFMKRYDSRMGLGSIISLMIPYAFILLGAWILLFIIWTMLGLPIGPGVGIYLD
ncbi:LOW QUALITY PROTEIN: aminobenzoyl-glutamate transport protein [Geomicrobium sp. JCM 19039]|nr:LOW QUALITY PROTEIN: aminobenzoyl-glutamate transport protein [Geomicrobium sp. JCM 19039]